MARLFCCLSGIEVQSVVAGLLWVDEVPEFLFACPVEPPLVFGTAAGQFAEAGLFADDKADGQAEAHPVVDFVEPAVTLFEAFRDFGFEILERPRCQSFVAAQPEEEEVVDESGRHAALVQPFHKVLVEFLVRLAGLLLELVCTCLDTAAQVFDFQWSEDGAAVDLDALQILLEILLYFRCRHCLVVL